VQTIINKRASQGFRAVTKVFQAETGIVLVDTKGRVVECDRGGSAILNGPGSGSGESSAMLPAEILGVLPELLDDQPADAPARRMRMRRGDNEYILRAYQVTVQDDPQAAPLIAILLERDPQTSADISEAVIKYGLTNREQQVLRGILTGLSTEQMVKEMNIAPNTLKAFLRLIMIKMRVKSRAGIVAEILENRPARRGAA
jgi:DNA-binding CsgD family transcriptional regulator